MTRYIFFKAPYWIVEFSSEHDVKRLASRSVSIKSCIELWATAEDIEGLHKKLKDIPETVWKPCFKPNLSFKIVVETFCRHITQKEKINKLEVSI